MSQAEIQKCKDCAQGYTIEENAAYPDHVELCPLHASTAELLGALRVALPIVESVYLDSCEGGNEGRYFEDLQKIKAALAASEGKKL